MNVAAAIDEVKWTIIGFHVSEYQACHGAPIQCGTSCDKCGAAIKYVVRVQNRKGDRMNVGTDCAVTLEGGPALAEVRRAERAYEREQWLKSPECARQRAEEQTRTERRMARAASNEIDFACELATLRAIVNSGASSSYAADTALGILKEFEGGYRAEDFSDDELSIVWGGLLAVYAPASQYVGSAGSRLKGKTALVAVLEAVIVIGLNSAYGPKYLHKFRTSRGEILTWFASGSSGAARSDVGKTYAVSGTVKEQNVYNGQSQTVLTRCKLEEVK